MLMMCPQQIKIKLILGFSTVAFSPSTIDLESLQKR